MTTLAPYALYAPFLLPAIVVAALIALAVLRGPREDAHRPETITPLDDDAYLVDCSCGGVYVAPTASPDAEHARHIKTSRRSAS